LPPHPIKKLNANTKAIPNKKYFFIKTPFFL
jgi:hypothetical protein